MNTQPDTKPSEGEISNNRESGRLDGLVRLFIGGEADGKWIRLPEDLFIYERLIAVKGMEVESQRYRLHRLAGESECYAVMVWNGINLDECLQRLLEAYKPNGELRDPRTES